MQASAPSRPRLIAAVSERSPWTSSQPSSRSFAALSGERTSATTSSPRSRSFSATFPPMNPVPPVRKTRMAGPYPEYVAEYGDGIRNPRARQRAFCIGAAPEDVDFTELRELLRTAGVAVTGEMSQHRAAAGPRPLLRQGQARGAEAGGEGGGRQPDRLRRRAPAAPGAQPRGGDRRAGDRPHGDHPRHLRRPRAHGRGQAPGRARAARVQPRAHARAVDAPRAARRRPYGRRHRHDEARARRRSRRTAASRATASPR